MPAGTVTYSPFDARICIRTLTVEAFRVDCQAQARRLPRRLLQRVQVAARPARLVLAKGPRGPSWLGIHPAATHGQG